jgi:hypothetical protein
MAMNRVLCVFLHSIDGSNLHNTTGPPPGLGCFFKTPGLSAAIANRNGEIPGAANCPCLHPDGRMDNKYCMKSGLLRSKIVTGQWIVFLKSIQKNLGGSAFAVSTKLHFVCFYFLIMVAHQVRGVMVVTSTPESAEYHRKHGSDTNCLYNIHPNVSCIRHVVVFSFLV